MTGVIKRLSVNFPRAALLRICKSFIRPHLDYGDFNYDRQNNESFKNKIENFSIKLPLQQLVLFKKHLENGYTTKWAWNPYD